LFSFIYSLFIVALCFCLFADLLFGAGTSDPYCRLKCSFVCILCSWDPFSYSCYLSAIDDLRFVCFLQNKQRFKTRVVDKTLSPRWDEAFKLYVSVQVQVLNAKDNFILLVFFCKLLLSSRFVSSKPVKTPPRFFSAPIYTLAKR